MRRSLRRPGWVDAIRATPQASGDPNDQTSLQSPHRRIDSRWEFFLDVLGLLIGLTFLAAAWWATSSPTAQLLW